DSAFASAQAYGIRQEVFGATGNYTVDNSGDITVGAHATATGDEAATANAFAEGIAQELSATVNVASFTNSGSVSVDALAIASGVAGSAVATAIGYSATGVTATLDVVNSGSMTVVASASGATTSSANATGINVGLGTGDTTVTNSGSLSVDAITANGGAASATGIQVLTTGAAGTTVINNSGDLIVRVSGDGGATFQRGMAINVVPSTTPSVINLLGGGNIYGNIDIQAGDIINVDNGMTTFDGIVNPECMPPVYDGVASTCGQGTLNITADGNLFLADPRITGDPDLYDGPSYVFVDTYNQAAGGTVTFDLQPAAGGTQAIGTYPQIFANTANIDGNLVAVVTTPNGLYADSYFWNNVIDAVTLNGTFDSCSIGGDQAPSPLLGLTCTYDGGENVDLGLARVAFNDLAGLTDNQLAVATALENVYDVTLTGPFSTLVAELFTLDQASLVDAFDQLSGVEYPNYLHSIRNSQFVLNTFVNDQLDCSIAPDGIENCRTPTEGGRVWILGQYGWNNLDSNDNAIGYEGNHWAGTLGGEYRFGNFALGAFFGYRNVDIDYPDALVGSDAEANGWHIGLTASYDVGSFYVRGIGSYSSLDGDSER
ncbi:MAG TPA: autotransporter domain-containing protein, partial [Vicinamibacterales bacterium]